MPFIRSRCVALLCGASIAAMSAGQACADAAAAPTEVSAVVVNARLTEARESIQPSLGATAYSVSNEAIQTLPGGSNQALSQVLLQLPGVVQDGFGQFHVRDDHNNLQYRINGVILPEGLSVFGQALSPRLIDKLSLITGALPAQYGLRTAGIVDITVKSAIETGGQVSLYGGGHGLYQPSFEFGASDGSSSAFVSADFRRSQLGIESPDGSSTPIHDRTDQAQAFAYVDRILGPGDRVSLIGGYTNQRFQIPNPRGLQPDAGYAVYGRTTFPSEDANQTQRETTGFAIASYLHDAGRYTVQTSVFARYSTLTYRPDVLAELLFNGLAQAAAKRDTAVGLQVEGVYSLSDAHTLRGGVILQGERATSATDTEVFRVDEAGAPIDDRPVAIADRRAANQRTLSVYGQDEWRIAPTLTLNYGLRFDAYDGFRSESQVSPRINAVWTPDDSTVVHLGYARYFSPPPFEIVGAASLALFNGTSGQPPSTSDTTPFAERQNYLDVGVQHTLARGIVLGVDAYDRRSRNLIDEGQFGAPIILTPFNYRDGHIRGVEVSLTYDRGPLSAYANLAVARAQGRDIVSSQFNFDPSDLAYIATHDVYLDHDQTYTASAGATWRLRDGVLAGSRVGADVLYGSGLRTDGAVPNGNALADYVQVNLSLSHGFGPLEARLDVINLFDRVYEIRDGSGIGVGAPQFGPRRGIFVGVTRTF